MDVAADGPAASLRSIAVHSADFQTGFRRARNHPTSRTYTIRAASRPCARTPHPPRPAATPPTHPPSAYRRHHGFLRRARTPRPSPNTL